LEDVGHGGYKRHNPGPRKRVKGEARDPGGRDGADADIGVLQTMSRMIYSGSYALAYGVVYATVFVAQMIPPDNSMMHGFLDGGKAAMDELNRS